MSNSFNPDQAPHFVGPCLDPNFCKGYQQMTSEGKELTCCQSDKMLGKALHLISFPDFFYENT